VDNLIATRIRWRRIPQLHFAITSPPGFGVWCARHKIVGPIDNLDVEIVSINQL